MQKLNFIRIKQKDDELIFRQLSLAEFLKINNSDYIEVFVNIKSAHQNSDERREIEKYYKTKLNEFITYACPKLQFMQLSADDYKSIFQDTVYIKNGWANESKMSGIYVGWGVETFNNELTFRHAENKIQLSWTCSVGDMDRYDGDFKPYQVEIFAELVLKEFNSKDEFWAHEKYKLDNHI